jgi:hypothetical protein
VDLKMASPEEARSAMERFMATERDGAN